MRSYSLSSAPDVGTYRISVKQELHGAGSSYLRRSLRPGAVLEAAAPRGDFVLDAADGPVLLISAGIGVTPLLSMLHELAAARSEREAWWLHGARSPREHPFAAEAHDLLASLPHAHEYIFYSAATPAERRRARAAAGRLGQGQAGQAGYPGQRERLYLRACVVHDRHAARPQRDRHRPGPRHTELFGARTSHQPRPDRAEAVRRTSRPALAGPGRW